MGTGSLITLFAVGHPAQTEASGSAVPVAWRHLRGASSATLGLEVEVWLADLSQEPKALVVCQVDHCLPALERQGRPQRLEPGPVWSSASEW